VKDGCPLIAWDTLTRDSLQKDIAVVEGPKFDGVVNVLFEYMYISLWIGLSCPRKHLRQRKRKRKRDQGNDEAGDCRKVNKRRHCAQLPCAVNTARR
jgi:hypothetical protein